MPFKYASPVDRLIANSIQDDKTGCWLWLGAVNNVGRPTIGVRVNGKPKKILVTRYIAEYIDKEKLPKKRRRGFRLHTCDAPLCVRPDHNRRGSQKENMRECVARGRHDPWAGVLVRHTARYSEYEFDTK